MTVTINGTTGYSGPVGTIGDLTTTGNTTLGDASGDTLTLNGNTASIPNGLNFTGGNMGLGVAPSAWRSINKVLQIGTVASIANIDATGSSGVDYGSNLYFDSGGTARYLITGASASFFRQQSGQFTWYTAGSGTAGNAVSYTQVLTLDASGNLGIGETSPAARIDLKSAATDFTGLILNNTSTNGKKYNIVSAGSGSYFDIPPGAFGIRDLTAGATRMVIDSSGNLLVGTTSGTYRMSVVQDGGTNTNSSLTGSALVIGRTSGYGEAIGMRVLSTGTGISGLAYAGQLQSNGTNTLEIYTAGPQPLVFGTSAAERARINSTGQFLVATTSDTSGMSGQANFVSGNMGIRTYTTGYQVTLNTGIPVNQGSYGGTILLMVSGHTSDQFNTQSALYLIRFPYNGDYTPTKYFITGSGDFVTVGTTGSAGSKTLTLYCDSIPTYTLIMCT